MEVTKKFLIVQLANFGDCLYATTIAKQIKHDHPHSHLTWAISDRYSSILSLNPHVDAVWKIPTSYGDIFTTAWERVVKEAKERQEAGEFDEIIFSQTTPRWTHYTGTLRNTILSTYGHPITVSKEPVVRLSQEEVDHVNDFAKKYKLEHFKNVVLFECSPTSGQADRMNTQSALHIAKTISEKDNTVCFILSTPQAIETGSNQIVDASELSFKENAELTKYCTLLIGCSSGITWISTSDWAKKLPMIQLLNRNFQLFYGVSYDHRLSHLPHEHIIEMLSFSPSDVMNCIIAILDGNFIEAKKAHHENYRVDRFNFRSTALLLLKYKHFIAPLPLLFRYKKNFAYVTYSGLSLSLLEAYMLFIVLACKKTLKLFR